VQVTLTPDRESLTVGDPVQLTLSINHPAGYQVIIPQLGRLWGDFEVLSQSQATTVVNDEGTQTTQQIIEVALFDLGEFQTPELPVTISDGAGGLFEEVVPSVALAVNPTLADDDTTLRDIKPQASLAVPPLWPWLAGGLVATALMVVGGWWGYRTWQGMPFGRAPAVDNRPPWQVAYDELERIRGLGLLEQGRFKEYYTLVTGCLRTYLAQQFSLRVHDRTTTELRPILQQSDLAPEQSRQFLTLFAESDLVKFAKFTPDPSLARQLVAEARSLVDATQPTPATGSTISGGPSATPAARPEFSYGSGQ
jgi:hypothetical protein